MVGVVCTDPRASAKQKHIKVKLLTDAFTGSSRRLRIPQKLRHLVAILYEHPDLPPWTNRVHSDVHTQSMSRIQGCPMSSCMFQAAIPTKLMEGVDAPERRHTEGGQVHAAFYLEGK